MTKEEVAKFFRVHPRTVERWLLNGSLKGYKLGKANTALWRISEDAINKFLAASSNQKKK